LQSLLPIEVKNKKQIEVTTLVEKLKYLGGLVLVILLLGGYIIG
jgi:hypothetical protein